MSEKKTFSQKLISSRIWGPIGISLSLIIGVSAVVIVFWRMLTTPGTPPGADPTSFAHTTKVIVDYFLATGHLPPIDLSWYAGFEHIAMPPGITVFLSVIYYFSRDLQFTIRLFQPIAVAIFFLSFFWMMKKEKFPTLNAFIGAVVFAFMPTIFDTYGSSTKMVALFFLPIAFHITNQILTRTEVKYIGYLAILESLILLAHPMTGIVFALFLMLYATAYAILDRNIVTRRFFFVIFSLALGVLLTGWYIIPFFLEPVNRTFAEATLPMVVNFVTAFNDIKYQIGGAVFIFLPLYIVWREKSAKLLALFLVGVLCMVIYFGYYYGLGNLFPFSMAYGYIWFFITGFVYAYLIGLVIPWTKVQDLPSGLLRIGLAICFLIFFMVESNGYIHFTKLENTTDEALKPEFDVAKIINDIPNPARVYPSHYPFGFTNWVLFLATNKPNIEGHYFGIAKLGKKIATMADAIQNDYPGYVVDKLELLNVRYFWANSVLEDIVDPKGKKVGDDMTKEIVKNGYQLIFQTDKKSTSGKAVYKLYYQDKPSTYLIPLDSKIFVIGKYNSTFAAAITPAKIKVLESGSTYFDDYDLEFLKHFDTVVLYGFDVRDNKKAEALAKEYTKQGGNLVIDLYNMGVSPLAGNCHFLGVNTVPRKLTAETKVEANGTSTLGALLPKSLNIPSEIFDVGNGILEESPLKEWNFSEFIGLDESLAQVPGDDLNTSVFGYKNINGHKVTFVGMNLFYHLYLTHDLNELKFVQSILKNPSRQPAVIAQNKDNLNSNEPQITPKDWTPEKIKFEINTNQDRLFLISLAYSPHWQGTLDGQPIKLRNIESMVVMDVPAGNHTLEMNYEPTKISLFGWMVTALIGLFILSLIIFSKKIYAKMEKH